MINETMQSYALFLLASIAANAWAACERDDLKELAIQYVDAQATGAVEDMPPFIDVATVSISKVSPFFVLLMFVSSCKSLGQSMHTYHYEDTISHCRSLSHSLLERR